MQIPRDINLNCEEPPQFHVLHHFRYISDIS